MSNDVISGVSVSPVETFDTADIAYQIIQVNQNLNIIVYLITTIFGLALGFVICYAIYKIIDICMR